MTMSIDDRALKMLAAGDSPADVSVATGLTKAEVEKLRRDFPGTRTQQDTPTRMPVRVGAGTPVTGVPADSLSHAITGAGLTAPVQLVRADQPSAPLTIARLLEEASVHSSPRIRNAGKAIETKLDQLRQHLQDLAAEEAAKQQAAAAKAKARAEARLEAELAAAKAKLKGQGGGIASRGEAQEGPRLTLDPRDARRRRRADARSQRREGVSR